MGLFMPNVEKLSSDGDVQSLLKCIEHRKGEIRFKAFAVLANRIENDENIKNRLSELLKDKDHKVRNLAVLKFASIGQAGLLDDLRSIIIHGSVNDKLEALRILADKKIIGEPEVSNMLVQALNDKKIIIQTEAIRTMGEIGDPGYLAYLKDKLNDLSYQVRLAAVKAIGKMKLDDTVTFLTSALVDNHREVRKTAQDSLEMIGTDKALKAFKDAPFMLLVKHMNENSHMRLKTAEKIGREKMMVGLPLLLKTVTDEYKNVRIESIKSLGLLRDTAAVEIILHLLDDQYYDVRFEAVKALERMNDPAALAGLKKAMNDKNSNVKKQARKSYYTMLDRIEKVKNRKR